MVDFPPDHDRSQYPATNNTGHGRAADYPPDNFASPKKKLCFHPILQGGQRTITNK
jgi:hypothetical protein